MGIDNIFNNVKKMVSIYQLLEEQKAINRKAGQAKCKLRKSERMKEFWKKKKEEQRKIKEDTEYYESLPKAEKYRSCTCWQGNAPCSYCTDRNYCEKCDIATWDEICPTCGQEIWKE